MQIIIDIPDYLYKVIQDCKIIEGDNEGNVENVLTKAVENGVVLPEGHGRLIDAEEVIKIANKTKDIHGAIWNASTIIEADKGDKE